MGESLGIYAPRVKAHKPSRTNYAAEMPRRTKTEPGDTRRGISETDVIAAKNVRRLLKQHGTISSQSELARKAAVDQSFISKFLRGKTSPSIHSIHQIAEAFGVPPWTILVPGEWDLGNPPVLQPITEAERKLYAAFHAMLAEHQTAGGRK